MKTYKTLEQAMQTNLEPVIISVEQFEHKGEKRNWIKARKAKGKRTYMITQYGNGLYSEAV